MKKRRSSRVAELKKSAAIAAASSIRRSNSRDNRSRETRAQARLLRQTKAEIDIENNNETDDNDKRRGGKLRSGRLSLDEMETQVVSEDDFEDDDDDDTNSDFTGSSRSSPETVMEEEDDDYMVKVKVKKIVQVKGKDSDKKTLIKGGIAKKSDEESSSDKENDKASKEKKETGEVENIDERIDVGDDELVEEDEAKEEWLGKAFGLRRSASRSPPENLEKSASKLKTRRKTEKPMIPGKPDGESEESTSTSASSSNKSEKSEPGKKTQLIVSSSGAITKDDSIAGKNPSDESVPETPKESGLDLRSAVADQEARALAKAYRSTLRKTEDYALNFLSTEIHLPVIPSFRDYNKADIKQIIGNKELKKSLNNVERSVLHLGLIDYLATANNNPLYGEMSNAKFSKGVGLLVQKILLDFKNTLGTFALSGNEEMSNRYTIIIRYLRNLVPLFKKAEFDFKLCDILDCIQREVSRLQSNQDKLKAMSEPSANSVSSSLSSVPSDKKLIPVSASAEEIVLDVNLNIRDDEHDSDDEDISFIGLSANNTSKIFGKPIKSSPSSTSRTSLKKTKIKKTPSTTSEIKTPKSGLASKSNSSSSIFQPKKLTSTFSSSTNSPSSSTTTSLSPSTRSIPVKRNASDELVKNALGGGEDSKKQKLDDIQSSPLSSKVEKGNGGIRNYFQILDNNAATNKSASLTDSNTPPVTKPKPVNAFALMMQKSRELAEQKKMKLAAKSVATAAGGTPKSSSGLKGPNVGTVEA